MEAQAVRTEVQDGWDVVDSQGAHLGTVAEVGVDYVRVATDRLMADDAYVPPSAIEAAADGEVRLCVPRDLI